MIPPAIREISLEIPRHLNDWRVDSALATLFQEKFPNQEPLSRSVATRLINEGKVLLNGEAVLSRVLVATHDQLTFSESVLAKNVEIKPFHGELPVRIIAEEKHFFIFDKGAGVQMHQGGSHREGTVAEWLLARYPYLAQVGDPARPGIVHRLDRDTSGVLVVAKDQETFVTLKTAFQKRLVEKTYLALVHGHLDEKQGEVTASLFRRPGELRRRAVIVDTAVQTLPGNVRSAFTAYRVLKRFQDYDLVELKPKTGRTHQLRVHLTFLGHPIVGDTLYTFKKSQQKGPLKPKRQLLHAARLAFELHGEPHVFTAPLADDFRQALQSIDETLVSSYDDEALEGIV